MAHFEYRRRLLSRLTKGALALGASAGCAVLILGSANAPTTAGLPTTASLSTAKLADATLPSLGVNVHSMWDSATTYPTEFPKYKTLGASWIRTDIDWAALEPTAGQMDPAYLSHMDSVVATANADGMNILLTVSDTPSWARPAGTTINMPPTDPATYASIMSYLATRYKSQAVAFEFWNEPDITASFTGASPATYTQMACAAYAAIKAVSPSTTVVAGTTSGEDITWLTQAFQSGLGPCFDVLSEHPYPTAPELVGADISTWEPTLITPSIQALMAQNGDGSKPIWFTEIGFSADGEGSAAPATEQVTLPEQAAFTTRFLQIVAQQLPEVKVVILYEGKDTASSRTPYEANLGILNDDMTAKPVYAAVQDLYNGTVVPALPTAPALPPTMSTVSPATGPSTTSVVITGTNFSAATQVTFGQLAASSFTVNSPTQITAIAPGQASGAHNVYVTTQYGTSNAVTAAQFTYNAPTVGAARPSSGPASGGSTVTITGAGFTAATKVAFGAVAATSFTVNSDTQITAVAPAEAAATHDIYITTPAGTNMAATADQFTYLAPTMTAISPTSGPSTTQVTITGVNFTGATSVAFGSVNSPSFIVNSDTQITATAPKEAAGTHNVYVTSPSGTTSAVTVAQYTFVAPVATGTSPATGPTAGGTKVTITGTDFTAATQVNFGAVAATGFTVNSDTQITANAPAEAAGTHYIYVTTPSGTNSGAAAGQFAFVAPVAPTLTALSPSSGPTTGGTSVTITGANFTGTSKVLFGAVAATSFTVNSDTQITAVAPAQLASTHAVYITTPAGTNSSTAAAQYSYLAPIMTAISPTSGPSTIQVVITGANFTGATSVAFGAVNSPSFIVNSDTQITATVPNEAAGTHNVYVTSPSGTTSATAAAQYTYVAPVVTALSPATGPSAGGTKVTITGTDFTAATQVNFGAVAATGFTVNSDTQITANAPAQADGAHYVYVTTPSGTNSGATASLFTYAG